MENTIILQGITVAQLMSQIDAIVEKRLNEKIAELSPKTVKYLTRKEVCQILKISMPTLYKWTLEGKIVSYRISSRVFYKSDEIESALLKRRFRY